MTSPFQRGTKCQIGGTVVEKKAKQTKLRIFVGALCQNRKWNSETEVIWW